MRLRLERLIRRCKGNEGLSEGVVPNGIILNVQEIVDAVIYLAGAPHVTGEVQYVDGGNDDDHSPDQFLDEEYREPLAADAQSR